MHGEKLCGMNPAGRRGERSPLRALPSRTSNDGSEAGEIEEHEDAE